MSKPKKVAARHERPKQKPEPEPVLPLRCAKKKSKASAGRDEGSNASPKKGKRADKKKSARLEGDTHDSSHKKRRKRKHKRKKKLSQKHRKRSQCLPPADWVEKLCDDVYPDVALHLFGRGTPWKRLYMLANAEPFNASGGMSLLGDKMRRGEEVIALRRRDGNSGVVVGDTSGYDVLRWNGACATVHDGEFSERPPRDVLHARIEWRQLGLPVRQALKAEPEIRSTYAARRKHCRGFSVGRVTDTCVEYDEKLADDIVDYVRGGAKLPDPIEVP